MLQGIYEVPVKLEVILLNRFGTYVPSLDYLRRQCASSRRSFNSATMPLDYPIAADNEEQLMTCVV